MSALNFNSMFTAIRIEVILSSLIFNFLFFLFLLSCCLPIHPRRIVVQSEQQRPPRICAWASLQRGISAQRAEGGDYSVLTSKEVCLTWAWRFAGRAGPWCSLSVLISPPQTLFAFCCSTAGSR